MEGCEHSHRTCDQCLYADACATAAELRERITKLEATQAVCHCGAYVKDHDSTSGHTAVEMVEGPCPDNARLNSLVTRLRADVDTVEAHLSACGYGYPATEGWGAFVGSLVTELHGGGEVGRDALTKAERALDLRRQLENPGGTGHATLDPWTVTTAEREALAAVRAARA